MFKVHRATGPAIMYLYFTHMAAGVVAEIRQLAWRTKVCAGAVNGDTCNRLVYAKQGVAASNIIRGRDSPHGVFDPLARWDLCLVRLRSFSVVSCRGGGLSTNYQLYSYIAI